MTVAEEFFLILWLKIAVNVGKRELCSYFNKNEVWPFSLCSVRSISVRRIKDMVLYHEYDWASTELSGATDWSMGKMGALRCLVRLKNECGASRGICLKKKWMPLLTTSLLASRGPWQKRNSCFTQELGVSQVHSWAMFKQFVDTWWVASTVVILLWVLQYFTSCLLASFFFQTQCLISCSCIVCVKTKYNLTLLRLGEEGGI